MWGGGWVGRPVCVKVVGRQKQSDRNELVRSGPVRLCRGVAWLSSSGIHGCVGGRRNGGKGVSTHDALQLHTVTCVLCSTQSLNDSGHPEHSLAAVVVCYCLPVSNKPCTRMCPVCRALSHTPSLYICGVCCVCLPACLPVCLYPVLLCVCVCVSVCVCVCWVVSAVVTRAGPSAPAGSTRPPPLSWWAAAGHHSPAQHTWTDSHAGSRCGWGGPKGGGE